MELRFTGKTALLTGGSSLLALELAKLLIAVDIYPILAWRREAGKEKIEEALATETGKFGITELNFSKIESLESCISNLEYEPDYLIDFAQSDYESYVASADEENIEQYYKENVFFRSAMVKAISRLMLKKRSGRLIFISSAAAHKPNPGQGFYSSAKLAGEAIYRNLGLELGKRGITTLSLRPGYVDVGRGTDYLDKDRKQILKKVPINRAISSLEVAESILFFLSESARSFNATEILLDGGLTAGK